ncbi:hypothetical protein FOA52_007871 [Chlamydomonas sp. UWO 241]|nr:hypothetical protein FOA52_007871 [Chlamydomonas sp. UWO 241]
MSQLEVAPASLEKRGSRPRYSQWETRQEIWNALTPAEGSQPADLSDGGYSSESDGEAGPEQQQQAPAAGPALEAPAEVVKPHAEVARDGSGAAAAAPRENDVNEPGSQEAAHHVRLTPQQQQQQQEQQERQELLAAERVVPRVANGSAGHPPAPAIMQPSAAPEPMASTAARYALASSAPTPAAPAPARPTGGAKRSGVAAPSSRKGGRQKGAASPPKGSLGLVKSPLMSTPKGSLGLVPLTGSGGSVGAAPEVVVVPGTPGTGLTDGMGGSAASTPRDSALMAAAEHAESRLVGVRSAAVLAVAAQHAQQQQQQQQASERQQLAERQQQQAERRQQQQQPQQMQQALDRQRLAAVAARQHAHSSAGAHAALDAFTPLSDVVPDSAGRSSDVVASSTGRRTLPDVTPPVVVVPSSAGGGGLHESAGHGSDVTVSSTGRKAPPAGPLVVVPSSAGDGHLSSAAAAGQVAGERDRAPAPAAMACQQPHREQSQQLPPSISQQPQRTQDVPTGGGGAGGSGAPTPWSESSFGSSFHRALDAVEQQRQHQQPPQAGGMAGVCDDPARLSGGAPLAGVGTAELAAAASQDDDDDGAAGGGDGSCGNDEGGAAKRGDAGGGDGDGGGVDGGVNPGVGSVNNGGGVRVDGPGAVGWQHEAWDDDDEDPEASQNPNPMTQRTEQRMAAQAARRMETGLGMTGIGAQRSSLPHSPGVSPAGGRFGSPQYGGGGGRMGMDMGSPPYPPGSVRVPGSGLSPGAGAASQTPHRVAMDAAAGLYARGSPRTQSLPGTPPLALEEYLPLALCDAYQRLGIYHPLYAWQAECLCKPGVLLGANIVYCAPTSGGKSMVAEILGLRRLAVTGKAFMLVLPYVALCEEKAKHLEPILDAMGLTVSKFYGGQSERTVMTDKTGVIICTIEKANALVNKMMEEDSLNQLGALIVDELHMVGDDERGYLLELLLTKLRFWTTAAEAAAGGSGREGASQHGAIPAAGGSVPSQGHGTASTSGARSNSAVLKNQDGLQIIGMSATMPNVSDVAAWLGAQLYLTTFRPVPLDQFIRVGDHLCDRNLKVVRALNVDPVWRKSDPDLFVWLTRETVDEGHSVLLFCGTKRECEMTAKKIVELLGVLPERTTVLTAGASQAPTRAALIAGLQRNGSINETLLMLLAHGVAFHHSGLITEERVAIETAYKVGLVSVLCATSTLAAGVNLPVRRVIFRHEWIGLPSNMIDSVRYSQMSGRAGRAGIDERGESVLLGREGNKERLANELMGECQIPIDSCLTQEKKGMRRAMLEVVVTGAVSTPSDISRYIQCTLLCATNKDSFQDVVANQTKDALKWLATEGFITWSASLTEPGKGSFLPNPLGKATLASGMAPEDALMIKEDLAQARNGFVMSSDLHLTFLVTPVKEDLHIEWSLYQHNFQRLNVEDQRVAEAVQVSQPFLLKMSMGGRQCAAATPVALVKQQKTEATAKRFFAALVLHDMIQEMPLEMVVEKWGLTKMGKGPLQGLQQRASMTAGMVAAFCERVGWHDLEMLVTKFQSRVYNGARAELVSLMEIPGVKTHRARLLFKAGFRTPEAVAESEGPGIILEILMAAGHSDKVSEAQHKNDSKRAARMIWNGANQLLKEKAAALNEQAAVMVAKLLSQTDASPHASRPSQPGAGAQASQQQQQAAKLASQAADQAVRSPEKRKVDVEGSQAEAPAGGFQHAQAGVAGAQQQQQQQRQQGRGQPHAPATAFQSASQKRWPSSHDAAVAASAAASGRGAAASASAAGGVGVGGGAYAPAAGGGAGGGGGAGVAPASAAAAAGGGASAAADGAGSGGTGGGAAPVPAGGAAAAAPNRASSTAHTTAAAAAEPSGPDAGGAGVSVPAIEVDGAALGAAGCGKRWLPEGAPSAGGAGGAPPAAPPLAYEQQRGAPSGGGGEGGGGAGGSGAGGGEGGGGAGGSGAANSRRGTSGGTSSSGGAGTGGVSTGAGTSNGGAGDAGDEGDDGGGPPLSQGASRRQRIASAASRAPGGGGGGNPRTATRPPPAPSPSACQMLMGVPQQLQQQQQQQHGQQQQQQHGQQQHGQQQQQQRSIAPVSASLPPTASAPAFATPSSGSGRPAAPSADAAATTAAGWPPGWGPGALGGASGGHGALLSVRGISVVIGAPEMRALAAALRADPSRPFGFALVMPVSGAAAGAPASARGHDGKLTSMALPSLPAASGGGSPSRRSGGGSGATSTSGGDPSSEGLEGIAIAVGDGCAFFVPLVPRAHSREYKEVASLVASLLADDQLTKAAFNIKQLLTGLGALRRAQARADEAALDSLMLVPRGDQGGAARPPARAYQQVLPDLRDSRLLVDVRIALFLAEPDNLDVHDDEAAAAGRTGAQSATKYLEKLLRARPGGGEAASEAIGGLRSGAQPPPGTSYPEVLSRLGVHNGAGGSSGATARSGSASGAGGSGTAGGGGSNPASESTRRSWLPSCGRQEDACKLACLARKLWVGLEARLRREGLLPVLYDIEMPMVCVLASLEARGMAVHRPTFEAERQPIVQRLKQVKAEAERRAAPYVFDINSPKQVSGLLFEHLKLPVPPQAQQNGKYPSTGKAVLADLEGLPKARGLPTLLILHRKLVKLLECLDISLSSAIRRCSGESELDIDLDIDLNRPSKKPRGDGGGGPRGGGGGDGGDGDIVRLRGTYLQTAAATGRLAMDEPNLQNVPKPLEFELLGTQGARDTGCSPEATTVVSNVRRAFVAPEGWVLLSADYCQIELRIIAHFSGDEALCAMLCIPGRDPFRSLAAKWRQTTEDQVSQEARNHAKHMVYGLLYGKGIQAVAADLGTSDLEEARALVEGFRTSIPGVDAWMRGVVIDCRSTEFVETLMHRRRYLPNINARGNAGAARESRSKAERQAVNTVCQGSAADLAKAAMVSLHALTRKDPRIAGRAAMVHMVHDEFLFEVRSDAVPEVARVIKGVLESVAQLRVPLPVKLQLGRSWGELEEYKV